MSWLHVRVVEATGLPMSSPYFKIYVNDPSSTSGDGAREDRFKSKDAQKVKARTTDPLWDQTHSFKITPSEVEAGHLFIDIKHKRKKGDKLIGQSLVELSYFKTHKQFKGWLPIRTPIKTKKRRGGDKDGRASKNTSPQTKAKSSHERKHSGSLNLNDFAKILPDDGTGFNTNESGLMAPGGASSDYSTDDSAYDSGPGAGNSTNIGDSIAQAQPLGQKQPLSKSKSVLEKEQEEAERQKQVQLDMMRRRKQKESGGSRQKYQRGKGASAGIDTSGSTEEKKLSVADADSNSYGLTQSGRIRGQSIGNSAAERAKTLMFESVALEGDEKEADKGESKENGVGSAENSIEDTTSVRVKDTGRVFIMMYFEKSVVFGATTVSESDLKEKREKFLYIKGEPEPTMPLRIYTATFNCGNAPLAGLFNWVPRDESIDLYVFGFQELKPEGHISYEAALANAKEVAANVSRSALKKSKQAANVAADKGKEAFSKLPPGMQAGAKSAGKKTLEMGKVGFAMGKSGFAAGKGRFNKFQKSRQKDKGAEREPDKQYDGATGIVAVSKEAVAASHGQKVDEDREHKHGSDVGGSKKDMITTQKEVRMLLNAHLGAGGTGGPNDIHLVCDWNMWQIRLFVFTRKKYKDVVSAVLIDHVATGIAGVGFNKGGVAVSLDFDGISLAFINSHLAAHMSKVQNRNDNYREICKGTHIGTSKQQLLGQFHHIFWVGDLNYRCEWQPSSMKGKHVHKDKADPDVFKQFIDKLEGGQMGRLFNGNDQLTRSLEINQAFYGFNEAMMPPPFGPTFKMKREEGSNYLDQRLPAWTDRILHRSAPGFQIKCLEYKSYPEIPNSDHKPVSALFECAYWHRTCGIDDDIGSVSIEFGECSASDLIAADVATQTSDPFVHFPRQLLLKKFMNSKRRNSTLSPRWKASHFGIMQLSRNNLNFISNTLFLFQIRDHDHFSGDDLIANGYMTLKEGIDNPGKFIKFSIALTFDGEPAGTFRGTYRINVKSRAEMERQASKKGIMGKLFGKKKGSSSSSKDKKKNRNAHKTTAGDAVL